VFAAGVPHALAACASIQISRTSFETKSAQPHPMHDERLTGWQVPSGNYLFLGSCLKMRFQPDWQRQLLLRPI
jgi:hypothetical protein